MSFEWYFRTLQSLQETPHFPPDLPGRLTYDCGGFYGVDHLLQGLQVRVLVSKLLLLVVKVASSLNLWKKMYFFPPQNSTWFYVKYMGISVKTEPVRHTRYLHNETFWVHHPDSLGSLLFSQPLFGHGHYKQVSNTQSSLPKKKRIILCLISLF